MLTDQYKGVWNPPQIRRFVNLCYSAKYKYDKKSRMSFLELSKTKTVEKLFKNSQNRPMIFNFFCVGHYTFCGDLDPSKTKIV